MLPMREHQVAVAEPSVLVGVGDVPVPGLLPGVPGLGMTLFAEGRGGPHVLQELGDDLLDALGGKVLVLALRPLVPPGLGRPSPLESTDPVVSDDEIVPQASRFQPRCGEGRPVLGTVRQPCDLDDPVNHLPWF